MSRRVRRIVELDVSGVGVGADVLVTGVLQVSRERASQATEGIVAFAGPQVPSPAVA
jgi:hypothetical protein